MSTCKRIKLDLYLTLQTKINTKWINGLNRKAQTTKLLEENTRVNLLDLRFDNRVLVMISKAGAKEKEQINLTSLNSKNLGLQRILSRNKKTTYRIGENLYKSHI